MEAGLANRLVVFGGSGFIGGHLCVEAMRQGYFVDSVGVERKADSVAIKSHLMDITRSGSARALLDEIRPDCVINLAAISRIDTAERERAAARKINVEAAAEIAEATDWIGAHFLHFSSDAVFAGTAESYRESDETRPVNFYGTTKAESEVAVGSGCPGATIVRISLALGFPVNSADTYLAALERSLSSDKPVTAEADEIRTPLDVSTICECVLELAAIQFRGVVHLGSTDSVDRISLARKCAERLGYTNARITEAMHRDPSRAPRHKRGVLDVSLARSVLRTTLPDVDGAIDRAIRTRTRQEK